MEIDLGVSNTCVVCVLIFAASTHGWVGPQSSTRRSGFRPCSHARLRLRRARRSHARAYLTSPQGRRCCCASVNESRIRLGTSEIAFGTAVGWLPGMVAASSAPDSHVSRVRENPHCQPVDMTASTSRKVPRTLDASDSQVCSSSSGLTLICKSLCGSSCLYPPVVAVRTDGS